VTSLRCGNTRARSAGAMRPKYGSALDYHPRHREFLPGIPSIRSKFTPFAVLCTAKRKLKRRTEWGHLFGCGLGRVAQTRRTAADGGRTEKKTRSHRNANGLNPNPQMKPSLPIGLGAWQGAGSVQIQRPIQKPRTLAGRYTSFSRSTRLIATRGGVPGSSESIIHQMGLPRAKRFFPCVNRTYGYCVFQMRNTSKLLCSIPHRRCQLCLVKYW